MNPEKPTILLADDDHAIRLVAGKALEKNGYLVHQMETIGGLMQALADPSFKVLVTDVAFPDGDALEILPQIKGLRPDIAIILMSARSTLLTAVKAQERGVSSYLPKPFALDDLIAAVENALSATTLSATMGGGEASLETQEQSPSPEQINSGQINSEQINPEQVNPEQANIDQSPLIGKSPAMQDIFRSMARLVHTNLAVIITGESGTGKEVVARALHDLGDRHDKPFIAINMAAIPRELIESELFGHEKGAFTGADRVHDGRFAQADGGTLMLDEIGDMPADAQTRLLRVLQDGSYTRVGGSRLLKSDVRIIAATNKDLERQIAQGIFREDLYYRLNVVPLRLPPLRKRRQDIPDLCRHFVQKSIQSGFASKRFSPEAMKILESWHWPGNVRELENLVIRLMVLVDDKVIQPSHLGELLDAKDSSHIHSDSGETLDGTLGGTSGGTLGGTLGEAAAFHISRYLRAHDAGSTPKDAYSRIIAEVEKPLLELVLDTTGGNQLRAAEMLGLNRNTLRKKIKQLNINRPMPSGGSSPKG